MINKEIERRFLIDYRYRLINGGTPRWLITQAYAAISHGTAVRIRKSTFVPDHKTTYELTGKGNRNGFSNDEANIPISAGQYEAWLTLCSDRVVDKTRETYHANEVRFDIDLFRGRLKPLAIVEVELPSEDHPFTPPEWFSDEVTHMLEYANASLAVNGLPEHFIHWCVARDIDLPTTTA